MQYRDLPAIATKSKLQPVSGPEQRDYAYRQLSNSSKRVRLALLWLLPGLILFSLLTITGNVAAKPAPRISKSEWQKLTNDKAFGYKNEKEEIKRYKPHKPGALEQFFVAFFRFLASGIGTLIIWLAIISVAIFIVYKLFFSKNSILFGKGSKMAGDGGSAENTDEDIATTNWEALMQQARNNNDHRLAVRYAYMRLLQIMQQKELIQYRNDKTNYDYYAELNESYKQSFRQLSRQYEYTWYGKFALSPAAYNDYLTQFTQVKKQLGA